MPNVNELWVLLLEKAWSKLFGSYTVTEAGTTSQALEYLLSVPSIEYWTKDQTDLEIYEKIWNADDKKWLITASSAGNASEEMGIVAGHAYSIISAYEVDGNRILKIRNPWGKFEWKGDYSDDSPLWTQELKDRVGYVKQDDGIFFMRCWDFKTYFETYTISAYHDSWHYSHVTGTNPQNHAAYYTFTIECD